MRHMDTTYDPDGVEVESSSEPGADGISAVDPAEAPAIAETIADRLAAELESAGAVLDPVQLPLEESDS